MGYFWLCSTLTSLMYHGTSALRWWHRLQSLSFLFYIHSSLNKAITSKPSLIIIICSPVSANHGHGGFSFRTGSIHVTEWPFRPSSGGRGCCCQIPPCYDFQHWSDRCRHLFYHHRHFRTSLLSSPLATITNVLRLCSGSVCSSWGTLLTSSELHCRCCSCCRRSSCSCSFPRCQVTSGTTTSSASTHLCCGLAATTCTVPAPSSAT